ncbi:MAG: hypothetical protein IPK50_03765 [Fibrobacterota bacterium]|nr:hypothetical protein [Fibrobacterota bacterium]QQS06012.1 MAG: hypothetical protein IPK50_03765 [Fibrobacterota bacterium]
MSCAILWVAAMAIAQTADPPQTISSATYGIRLPVPQGWTPRVTDTSLTVSSNAESGGKTVVVGVQFSVGLSPYATEKDWREQTMSAFLRYLQSNYGRLLTPNSKGVFRGDSTENANYLALDPKSRLLFAGQSRFLARDGKGFELFVMGDTLPIYADFPKYEAILESMEWGTSSLGPIGHSKDGLRLERSGGTELVLRSATPLQDVRITDLRGRGVGAVLTRMDPFSVHILRKSSGWAPLLVSSGSRSILFVP